jgi:hypothetical protein
MKFPAIFLSRVFLLKVNLDRKIRGGKMTERRGDRLINYSQMIF